MLQQIQIMAQLLRSCRHLIFASYTIFALSLFIALFVGLRAWSLIFYMVGISSLLLVQIYLHSRVQFDAALLHQLTQSSEVELSWQTEQMDQALAALGLADQKKLGRPWSQRLRGCLMLVRWQVAFLILQFFGWFWLIQQTYF
ncbi:hypothetical protein [Acinetobacter brisouii]|jgi:hypothetical protein|uniref:hypothetical protein n=1 Tax=Acinetobacter brisouii TaxID=396323 RepID=UPI0012507EF6|nr:hypothetical protein [Acinetobacter brisouii]